MRQRDPAAAVEPTAGPSGRRATRWAAWLAGAVGLGAVVALALHLSEARQFIRIAEQARPWWMALAFLLQAGTYLAAALIWRSVARVARVPLSLGAAYGLSLVKLFVDQALPSGGISGTVVVARALERRGVGRRVVMAGVVVDTAAYYLAYVVCLATAVGIAFAHRQSSALVEIVAAAFALVALALTAMLVALSGRGPGSLTGRLRRAGFLRPLLARFEDADRALTRDPGLLLRAIGLQLVVFLLDATTMWVVVAALGERVPAASVFASFMIASLFRTFGILPGGLGTFEATSVLTLNLVGVDVAVALAATLLFRGLSFWLPMLPGLWLYRSAARAHAATRVEAVVEDYWAIEPAALLRRLDASPTGLTAREAEARRLARAGVGIDGRRRRSRWRVLVDQVRSPLLLLLLFAAVLSAVTGAWTDATVVLTIVVATVVVGFTREDRAEHAAARLRARVRTRSMVLRDATPIQVPAEDVVQGDVLLLAAGALVPADAVVLDANDCYVSEAVLTGESFPVEKRPGPCDAAATLARRSNCVFLGTNVRSGTATCLVVATGRGTQYGAIARRLASRPPETEFDRGVRRFGYLLTSSMLVMVLVVFVAHVLMARPPVETLLFVVALAVGLSPELLPAVLGVSLARGATLMARAGVLVRRLTAIENLGSMDVLCTDKTGTLTAGVIELEGAFGPDGAPATDVLELGAVNAAFQTGLPSPLDEAILRARRPPGDAWRKRAEVPFDFVRKRVSVVVEGADGALLVAKGAVGPLLDACAWLPDGAPLDARARGALELWHDDRSRRGIRVLALATKAVSATGPHGRGEEADLTFRGFLTFMDLPKEGVADVLAGLASLGVAVKVITGDTRLVAERVAAQVGLRGERVLTGSQLGRMSDEALWREAEGTDLFVEVDPNQKERIILALKRTGHVVGFLGDGVNDAPAMHAADTSLSVDQAVDVAREAADFVLLERDLDVIRRGIVEGRRTFANTLKYIQITMSANLGNMLSMAAASLFLPFLPLLPGQILLNNFLSDVPAVGIADDSVDPEFVARPRRWDMRFVARFMVGFGLLSSAFDGLTFALLLGAFRAAPELFRTGWFVESLLTELVVALVVRTRRPFYRSRPGRVLLVSSQVLIVLTLAIPYLPRAGVLGFVPLPAALLGALVAVAVAYVAAVEGVKRLVFRSAGDGGRGAEPPRGTEAVIAS